MDNAIAKLKGEINAAGHCLTFKKVSCPKWYQTHQVIQIGKYDTDKCWVNCGSSIGKTKLNSARARLSGRSSAPTA